MSVQVQQLAALIQFNLIPFNKTVCIGLGTVPGWFNLIVVIIMSA